MDITLPKLKTALEATVQRNNITANNLANLDNAGYKRDVAFFELIQAEDGQPDMRLRTYTSFGQGTLTETGNALDLAISGAGFFTVETEQGEALTRDGHFQLDTDGVLRTSGGQAVLGEAGPIVLTTDGRTPGVVRITRSGEVFVDDELRDRLRISAVPDPQALRKGGDNLLLAADDVPLGTVEAPDVQQGFLEESNVSAVDEMMTLIEIQRQFESTQKMVRTLDEVFQQAATQVGRYS